MLCLVNYMDIWTKIVKSVGLEDLAFTDVFDESRVENGKKLVKIERSTRQRSGGNALGVISTSNAAFELNLRSSDEDENDEATSLL